MDTVLIWILGGMFVTALVLAALRIGLDLYEWLTGDNCHNDNNTQI